jgi:hypothetical protein
VVFRWIQKENHPVCAQLRKLRGILLVGAATPPSGDARRGIRLFETFRIFLRLRKRGALEFIHFVYAGGVPG